MPSMMYRKSLPHWRADHATYFCTWRVHANRGDLSAVERDVVCGALRHFDGARYALHGFVVMNDHVHVLLTPTDGFALGKILHSWKSFTAHAIQRSSVRGGSVWQAEYFDRIVRDESDFLAIAHYIASNPRKRWPASDEPYPWLQP
jgi:REP element-mobilizing transposase RayT